MTSTYGWTVFISFSSNQTPCIQISFYTNRYRTERDRVKSLKWRDIKNCLSKIHNKYLCCYFDCL